MTQADPGKCECKSEPYKKRRSYHIRIRLIRGYINQQSNSIVQLPNAIDRPIRVDQPGPTRIRRVHQISRPRDIGLLINPRQHSLQEASDLRNAAPVRAKLGDVYGLVELRVRAGDVVLKGRGAVRIAVPV